MKCGVAGGGGPRWTLKQEVRAKWGEGTGNCKTGGEKAREGLVGRKWEGATKAGEDGAACGGQGGGVDGL